ncbi:MULTISPECIES: RHS repeat-associated core domain-containing protein [unclassified Microcoleus]|uniref:RHS repeat-associated core domain-containing protein n=1 Tax=unclassified Microcoleus TaxID=2642155 RepID=UPI002FD0AEBE
MKRLTISSFSEFKSLKSIANREQLQDIKKITYTYDSMNRRVARTDENGTTQYLYGNPNHPFQLTAVRSPSGSLSRYHYDDFGLLFALERDNNWYCITTDQLGTPRVVCDANGTLVKVLEYDSFGQIMADSNSEFELHISFAGGLIDVDTELVRFGFRDYDAVAGKWTAKDPISFAGGDNNLYGYVNNSPVNFKDPTGQIVPFIVIGGIALTVEEFGAIYLGGVGLTYLGSNAIRNQDIHFGFDIRPIGRCPQTPNNKPNGTGSPKPPKNKPTPEDLAKIEFIRQLGEKARQAKANELANAIETNYQAWVKSTQEWWRRMIDELLKTKN